MGAGLALAAHVDWPEAPHFLAWPWERVAAARDRAIAVLQRQNEALSVLFRNEVHTRLLRPEVANLRGGVGEELLRFWHPPRIDFTQLYVNNCDFQEIFFDPGT
jgi:hypothetical protein